MLKEAQPPIPGSWGPADADALLVRGGRVWHDPLT
jgi:hypothetical protein